MFNNIEKDPAFCLGGIEQILKSQYYITDHQKIVAITKHMKEFYKLKKWEWEN